VRPDSSIVPFNKTISLCAEDNAKWVCAEDQGSAPLIANRERPGDWESFMVVHVPDAASSNVVAFIAKANGKFVCAEESGKAPLIANREVRGLWEAFFWIVNFDKTVSLQALANNLRIMSKGGSEPLIANQSEVGIFSKFSIRVW
jgi:hypothetical protein